MSTEHGPAVEAISRAYSEYIEREERRGPRNAHNYVYASSRRRCLRRSVLECTQPDLFSGFDADTKARFLRGKQRELDVVIALQRAGQLSIPKFEFVGQQASVKVFDRKQRLVISGMIDGYLRWESGTKWPVEIKSLSQFTTDRIQTFEDMFAGKYTWANAHQLLAYQYSENAPFGLFVLDRPGLPKLLKVDLEAHLSAMESFLQDATTIVDHIEAKTLPDYIQDPSECKRCPVFGSHCNPPVSYAGARIIVDDEVIAKTERYAELQGMPELEEFQELDAWAKEQFRGVTVPTIVGRCVVNGKWQKDTKYPDITKEVKDQINALRAPFAKKVEQGKYFLTVKKVSE